MHILRLTLAIVIVAGCFRPPLWTSLFKRAAYSIYRLYIFSMLYAFAMMQFMDILLNVDNPDDFTNNLNMLLTTSSACYKIIIMWISNADIAMLIDYLTEEPFKPLDPAEREIERKFEKIIRNNTMRYTILIETTCLFIALASLLTDFRHRKLTYREWVPYDYSSYMLYCLTYAQQMISTLHCATVNVACDTLICALLMHVCCQIEILEYRLKNICTNRYSVGYCIRHHNRIFEYAHLVNVRFSYIIGYQFIASTFVICTNLYQLTRSTLSAEHVQLIMYTVCMLTEIFIYCWFGNKVKVKSLQLTDYIFQMEWPTLHNDIKKSLLIIMKRSLVPIEMSTAHIMTLNLESFVGLLKTSYSAYNLVSQTQAE